jgi:biopolymer transport protein ExbD
MVDLAFLLVTFFMLISQFRAEEAAVVDMPSSVSDLKIPDKDLMMILVDKEDHVYFTITGQETRLKVLNKMGEKYKVVFTEEQQKEFSNMASFGIPMSQMKEYLSAGSTERKKIQEKSEGIPSDSTACELCDWVFYGRINAPTFRVAIKGDQQTSYPKIRRVMDVLQDKKVNRFNLITNMETGTTE